MRAGRAGAREGTRETEKTNVARRREKQGVESVNERKRDSERRENMDLYELVKKAVKKTKTRKLQNDKKSVKRQGKGGKKDKKIVHTKER